MTISSRGDGRLPVGLASANALVDGDEGSVSWKEKSLSAVSKGRETGGGGVAVFNGLGMCDEALEATGGMVNGMEVEALDSGEV